jgi:hypothetical protein
MSTTTPSTGSPRKTPGKKKAARARRRKPVLAQLEADLPPTLRDFSRRVSSGLVQLEKRIEEDGRDARRQGVRMLREASHRLGQLEAQGEREWRRQTLRARRATVTLLHRLERAVEPPRKARPRKKTAARARAAAAPAPPA